jgi:hypothetical protein
MIMASVMLSVEHFFTLEYEGMLSITLSIIGDGW